MKLNFIVSIAFLSSTFLFAQSAWTLEENTWYTQVNFSTIGPYSGLFVDGNDNIDIPRELTDNTLQFYAEYGLDNKTTLSTNIPVKFISSGDEIIPNSGTKSTSVSSIGNISFGIKRNIYNKKFVASGLLLIEANTSTFDEISGIRTGYDAWAISPSIGVGKGFSNLFVQGNLGIDFRTNNYSHSFKANAEGGYKFFEVVWVILHLDYIKSFENGEVEFPIQYLNTLLYVNDQEYAGYTLKGIFEINNHFGVTGAFGGAFSANLQARKAALSIGAYYKFGR